MKQLQILNIDVLRLLIQNEILVFIEKYPDKKFTLPNFQNSNTTNKISIVPPIGWLKAENILFELYNFLAKRAFIQCSFEDFRKHFIGSENAKEKIRWFFNVKYLAQLFIWLKNDFIPDHREIFKLLFQHFSDRKGNDLKIDSLRSSMNTLKKEKINKNKKLREIAELVSNLKKFTENSQ